MTEVESTHRATGAAAMERVVLAHMRPGGNFDESKVKRDGDGQFTSNSSSKKVKELDKLSEEHKQKLLDKYGEALFESSSMEDYLANLPKDQDVEGTRTELETDLAIMAAEYKATSSNLGAKYSGPTPKPKKPVLTFNHAMALDDFIAGMQKVQEGDALQFGIKGMRWGVRRSKAELAGNTTDADPDAIKAVQTQAKITAAGTLNVVSSKDLQQLVDRIKLEQKYVDTTLAGSPTTQRGKSMLSKVAGVIGREFTMKASGKDGPLLMGYKFLKAKRTEQVSAAAKAASAASQARAQQKAAQSLQKQREAQAAYNSPSNSRRHPGPYTTTRMTTNGPGPAQRRTEYAGRVYNVTTLNALGPGGNPLALPPRRKP